MMTEKDFKALVKSREILESVQHRTPFGRSLTIHNGKWDDTDKAVIGYYEAGTVIDPSNPIAVDKYITESAYFLNNLNEHLHMDGYHFDMTGTTNGTVYFAKDRDWYGEGMTTSDDESSIYVQEAAYRVYLMNKDRCQQQVRHMIDETMILTDDQLAITEKVDSLLILNEGIGDKISDIWDKFVAFINKIFNKFMEFVTRTVNSDKAYLEKYKDIILHRKYKAQEFDVDGNYSLGVHRLSTYQLAFPDTAKIESLPTDNEETGRKQVQIMLLPDYEKSSGVDFNDYTKTWFKGGEDGKSTRIDESVNLTDLYNFCYNFNKIEKNLKKNQSLLNTASTNFKNAAKEKFETARKTLAPAANANASVAANSNSSVTGGGDNASLTDGQDDKKVTPDTAHAEVEKKTQTQDQRNTEKSSDVKIQDNPDGTVSYMISFPSNRLSSFTAPKGSPRLDKAALYDKTRSEINDVVKKNNISGVTIRHESASFYGLYRSIREASSGLSKAGAGTTAGTGSTPGHLNNLTNGQNSMRERQGQGSDVNTNDAKNLEELNKKEDAFNKQASYLTSSATIIFSSMLTAAETIKKDYMKIISTHVKSYMGEKETERSENKQAAQGATDYSAGTGVSFSAEKVAKAGIEGVSTVNDLCTKLEKLRDDQNSNDEAVKTKANQDLYDILHKISGMNMGRFGGPNKVYNNVQDALNDLAPYRENQQQQA